MTIFTPKLSLPLALLCCAAFLGLWGCEDNAPKISGNNGAPGTDTDALPKDSNGNPIFDSDSKPPLDIPMPTDNEKRDSDEIIAIEMDCSQCPALGGELSDLLCAIDLCDADVVLDQQYSSPMTFTHPECTVEDTRHAIAHLGSEANDLKPKKNNSYVVMATGSVNRSDNFHSMDCVNSMDDNVKGLNDDFVGDTDGTMYDVVEWKLQLKAPDDAKGFRFKYVFFSSEYDDYISSEHNDKFYAILNAPTTTEGKDRVINYTNCRDHFNYYDFGGEDCNTSTGFCCYIAINSAMSDCCWYPYLSPFVHNSPSLAPCPDVKDFTTDISGTGYECAPSYAEDGHQAGSSTGWLQTSWPIEGGETFTLTFHLHDTADGHFDSQVILDAFEFTTTPSDGITIIIPPID
ncbi:MAG: hypothetical protein GX146_05090 [Myxococcales bacterium]|jgi:hypothetical protein|nr:hypothetical protein [Myxococcales bacterium]